MKSIKKFKSHIIIKVLVIAVLYILVLSFIGAVAETGKLREVTIECFYLSACESCPTGDDYYAALEMIAQKYDNYADIRIKMYNTFLFDNKDKFEEYRQRFDVPDDTPNYDVMVFINDIYLSGTEEINNKLAKEIEDAINNPNSINTQKSEISQSKSENQLDTIRLKTNPKDEAVIVYFYFPLCSSCDKVQEYFEKLNSGKEKALIYKYNAGAQENLGIIKEYFEYFNVPTDKQKVPILFIDEVFLEGEEEIIGKLEMILSRGGGKNTLLPESNIYLDTSQNYMSGYKAAGVFFTGLLNGLNPCSVSMLLFFISMLIAGNRNILKLGFSFIFGKFLAYFLLGTILYSLLGKAESSVLASFQGLTKGFLLIISGILIVMNIRDYFAVKRDAYGSINAQLPEFLRKLNHNWIRQAAAVHNSAVLTAVSFGLGMLISLGEFLCTGQIYLATIIYILKDGNEQSLIAAAYFLIYGVALILPLVLITILINKGKEIFDLTDIFVEKLHIIKLINAGVFVVFASIVFILF